MEELSFIGEIPSASVDEEIAMETSSTISGTYQIVDTNILGKTFHKLACPECFQTDCFDLTDTKNQRLSLQLVLTCSKCLYQLDFSTSKRLNKFAVMTSTSALFMPFAEFVTAMQQSTSFLF